jgi:hypothetical protein
MTTFSNSAIPQPQIWQEFESLCCDLWKELWHDPYAQRNGRSGQAQHGVDVFGRPNGGDRYHGVQCKGKDAFKHESVSIDELETEVQKAKSFNPPLAHFILATTGPKDARVEERARQLTAEHLGKSLFSVTVLSWPDILELLARHPKVIERHYQYRLSPSSFERKQEALLVAKNPTSIEISDLVLQHWAGDEEDFLTIKILNTSELPAKNIKISVLRPSEAQGADSERVMFSVSVAFHAYQERGFSLLGGKTMLVPIGSISEFAANFSADVSGFNVIGVGMSPNVPDELTLEHLNQSISLRDDEGPLLASGFVETRAKPFGILVSYTSVLEEQLSFLTGGYVYWLKNNNG